MKAEALRFLACPRCKSELELVAHSTQDAEVIEGRLRCVECGSEWPIVRGVPRFVEHDDYAASFGREWNWFPTVQLDSLSRTRESEEMLEATTGWQGGDYTRRLVLDAGVGAGRFAEIVARKGGVVVGVDLSSAIDAAYANLGSDPNVHLIQANIFALPFRESTFDLGYSIGVLHHTPDPRTAFDRVAATIKKGGGFAVYLYHGYGLSRRFSDAIRVVTTRLPLRLMLALSTLAIPFYYVYRVPALGKILQIVCPVSLHPDWRWRWLDTFDWYTPKYQWKFLYPDVFRWFRVNGFHDVEVFDDPIRMRGTKTG